MDLDRVGAKLGQQGGHGGGAEHRLALPNQAEGTGGQATATAVAAIRLHPAHGADRQGRTDPLAGPGAIRRTEARIEAGLAEMGVIAIAQAHHQPGSFEALGQLLELALPVALGLGPGHATPRRGNRRRIGRHINAIDADQAVKGTQVFDRRQVVVAGPADQFDPLAPGQGQLRRHPAQAAT